MWFLFLVYFSLLYVWQCKACGCEQACWASRRNTNERVQWTTQRRGKPGSWLMCLVRSFFLFESGIQSLQHIHSHPPRKPLLWTQWPHNYVTVIGPFLQLLLKKYDGERIMLSQLHKSFRSWWNYDPKLLKQRRGELSNSLTCFSFSVSSLSSYLVLSTNYLNWETWWGDNIDGSKTVMETQQRSEKPSLQLSSTFSGIMQETGKSCQFIDSDCNLIKWDKDAGRQGISRSPSQPNAWTASSQGQRCCLSKSTKFPVLKRTQRISSLHSLSGTTHSSISTSGYFWLSDKHTSICELWCPNVLVMDIKLNEPYGQETSDQQECYDHQTAEVNLSYPRVLVGCRGKSLSDWTWF